MKFAPVRSASCVAVLLMSLVHSVPANAVGLLLPAVQAAREPARSEPLQVTIGSLGTFEAGENGDLPILSLGFPGGGFDATGVGDLDEVPTELLGMNLRGTNPVIVGGDPFDVVIDLYPPDPIVPTNIQFLTTAASADGSSASGELKGAYHFIVEVALIDPLDPKNITTFLHDDVLEIYALWHSEGRQLVIDSPIDVHGMIEGKLGVVPLPAGIYLFLSGLLALGMGARKRIANR